MNDQQPPDLTLAEAAVAMHEMFLGFLAAGFTESQALRLVAMATKPQCVCGGPQ